MEIINHSWFCGSDRVMSSEYKVDKPHRSDFRTNSIGLTPLLAKGTPAYIALQNYISDQYFKSKIAFYLDL